MSGDGAKYDAQYGMPSSIKPNRMLAEPGGLEYKKKVLPIFAMPMPILIVSFLATILKKLHTTIILSKFC